MIYVYDILLNWGNEFIYDFFEWEKTDNLEHIKRIPLYRVEKGVISDMLNFDVKIHSDFMNKLGNWTEIYSSKKILRIPYTFLISDSETVLALRCNKNGNVKYKSKLLIDEEEEILCVSSRLNKNDLSYEKGKPIDTPPFFTREELKIKKYLLNVLDNSYKNKHYEKIKYLYTEYFNESISDVLEAYEKLIETLNGELNYKHNELYNLLQLIGNKN